MLRHQRERFDIEDKSDGRSLRPELRVALRGREKYAEFAILAESFARGCRVRHQPAGGCGRERNPIPVHARELVLQR
jgi:hypothetical protein